MLANAFSKLCSTGLLIVGVSLAPALASASCIGDCNDDAQVTISELVTGVNVALERLESSVCRAFDGNRDEQITVDELVKAVTNLLDECPFAVVYDRTNTREAVPFPDDFWLEDDSQTPTGKRIHLPIPNAPADIQRVFTALAEDTNKLDGFSPISHFVVELTDGADPDSLPRTPAESLEPASTVRLFDLSGAEPVFGRRIPVLVKPRTDTTPPGTSHTLLIFPSVPLTPGASYALVLTRDIRARLDRRLRPSAFFTKAMAATAPGEAAAIARTRALLADVTDRGLIDVPAENTALMLRISVRSTDTIPNDLLAIKSQVLAADPPALTVTSVEPDPEGNPNVAAIVRGTWRAPEWRAERSTTNGPRRLYLARGDDGLPVQSTTKDVAFILALPTAALDGPVPITMYQHGNPGSAEREVPNTARRYLAAAGFAVIGFTDTLNRELSAGIEDRNQAILAQVAGIVFPLVDYRKVPDYWVETTAEQLAFLRMIQAIGSLDVLPIDAADGTPEIDPSRPLTYVGISEGANNGPAFLPYAPEIRAAALVVGGARLAEVLIHQQAESFISGLNALYPSTTPADIWVGFALFQTIFDVQDRHNHAPFLYRSPLEVAGTTRKASILVIEGINDTLVPNHATESLAWSMGPIPHLQPVQRAVPFLGTVTGPVVANIDPQTTSAFYQYVPVGVPGIDPTPGCTTLTPSSATEGHYCAQSAAESQHQRVVFFETALTDEAPTIIDPLSAP